MTMKPWLLVLGGTHTLDDPGEIMYGDQIILAVVGGDGNKGGESCESSSHEDDD